MCTPALRVVGNIVSCDNDAWARAVCEHATFLSLLGVELRGGVTGHAAGEFDVARAKEAAWVAANLAMCEECGAALMASGVGVLLAQVLCDAPFEAASEAAQALVNLLCVGRSSALHFPAILPLGTEDGDRVLKAYLGLLRGAVDVSRGWRRWRADDAVAVAWSRRHALDATAPS